MTVKDYRLEDKGDGRTYTVLHDAVLMYKGHEAVSAGMTAEGLFEQPRRGLFMISRIGTSTVVHEKWYDSNFTYLTISDQDESQVDRIRSGNEDSVGRKLEQLFDREKSAEEIRQRIEAFEQSQKGD